jgi:hypothetical protein
MRVQKFSDTVQGRRGSSFVGLRTRLKYGSQLSLHPRRLTGFDNIGLQSGWASVDVVRQVDVTE